MMQNLQGLRDLVEASSNADIARGAASALRWKLKDPAARSDEERSLDERSLNDLETLLGHLERSLESDDGPLSTPPMRNLRGDGQSVASGSPLDSAAVRRTLDDVRAIRSSPKADRSRVLHVLTVLEDLMQASLDSAWRARRGGAHSY